MFNAVLQKQHGDLPTKRGHIDSVGKVLDDSVAKEFYDRVGLSV